VLIADKLLPAQLNPDPMYPSRHVHLKLPSVLVQIASGWQPPLFVAHSFISGLIQQIGLC